MTDAAILGPVRGAIVLVAGLALAAPAAAAPPQVTANPASRGCVQIPMWIAPSLYGAHGQGTTVVVHL